MSIAKGARLYLKQGDGRKPQWIIKDGPSGRIATGCAAGEREAAERKLAEYIAQKYRPSREKSRDPSAVKIADVLNIYLNEVTVARPKELGQRVLSLAEFFGDKTLAHVSAKVHVEYRGLGADRSR